jgi:pimeloyl-ACP methyl ester carboxylesterase
MRRDLALVILLAAVLASALVFGAAQNAPAPTPPAQLPPLGTGLSADEKALLQVRVDELAVRVASLKSRYRSAPMADRIADVEVYLDAVRRPLKYDERLYAGRGSTPTAYARQTIATGLLRAEALARGVTPWMTESGVRGFYSRIDGSAQPYILTMPENYDAAAKRTYRLDIFLHGRDDQVLEQQFMTKSTTGYTSKPFRAGPDRFMLQPYGRYTNANRFAGEVDGLEAIESVTKAYPIDSDRMVMAGFSMGGASAWHYGMHFADRWAAVAPGAGFTETAVYLRNAHQTRPQNAVQRRLWHWYDSTDYAMNAFNVPVVAYSGEIDPQKQAADAMAAAMQAEGLTLEHLIGPKTGHSYEAGARRQLQDRLDQIAAKGRQRVPAEIRFTTWTLRYNRMFWITVDALGETWARARVQAKVDGEAIAMTTANVTALHIAFDAGLAPFAAGVRPRLTIDGTQVLLPTVGRDKSLRAGLIKTAGAWALGDLPANVVRKAHGLQGPIDDAFMDAFMVVRPTGTAFSDALGAWVRGQAESAILEWTHFFRGEPRVKNDTAVTDADIAANHLVLFGDPSSNAVYRRIAGRLPIVWRADGVTVGDAKYPATHVPVFIFPNPLNPKKYVVINSGFTFHDHTSNAMQSPKLPDWAVVDITKPGNNYRYLPLYVELQGFFDEDWRLQGPMAP